MKQKQSGMERSDEPFDRPLPNSSEAEHAILGAILLEPDLIHQATRLLKPGDFYNQAHRRIYAVMVILANESMPIESIMIGERLKKAGYLEQCGGFSFITNLTYGIPHSTNITHYADVVRTHSKARRAIDLCERHVEALLEGVDPKEVLERLFMDVSETKEGYEHLRRPMSLDEMYDDQALRYLMFLKGISDATPTGFPEIDEKLLGGGLVPSFLYYIAGRPSMGKTTFALDVVCNAADAGKRCLWVTREMPRSSVIDRMVAAKSGIERFKISAGLTQKQHDIILETLESMRLVPIIIDDFSETIEELDGWLADYERKGQRIDLLAADYVQLFRGDRGGNRTNEVSDISRGFKRLAVKWEIPVIGVSQLKRGDGPRREPELSDLRESGQLEQDADAVIFVDGGVPEEGLDFYQRDFLCKKQREGPLFRRTLSMNAELVTFRTSSMLGHSAVIKRPVPIVPAPTAGKANDYEEMHDVKKELDRQKARGKAAKQNKAAAGQNTYGFD